MEKRIVVFEQPIKDYYRNLVVPLTKLVPKRQLSEIVEELEACGLSFAISRNGGKYRLWRQMIEGERLIDIFEDTLEMQDMISKRNFIEFWHEGIKQRAHNPKPEKKKREFNGKS